MEPDSPRWATFSLGIHWLSRVFMKSTLSSFAVHAGVITTNCGPASDDKFGISLNHSLILNSPRCYCRNEDLVSSWQLSVFHIWYIGQLYQRAGIIVSNGLALLELWGWGVCLIAVHDDVIKWKHFPRYWPFVRGIHRSPVDSPHKGQRRRALMFSLICAWTNGWATTETLVIWDAIALIMTSLSWDVNSSPDEVRHCGFAQHSKKYFYA